MSTSEDLGRLSAEAVQAQYEAAAKAVEGMGVEVKERISKLEAAMRECDQDLRLLADAASAIREKGNLIAAQIDEAAILSSEIRSKASEFRDRLKTNGKATEKPPTTVSIAPTTDPPVRISSPSPRLRSLDELPLPMPPSRDRPHLLFTRQTDE